MFVLSLAFKGSIPCSVFVKCGQKTLTTYIDVSSVVRMLGAELDLSQVSMPSLAATVSVLSLESAIH